MKTMKKPQSIASLLVALAFLAGHIAWAQQAATAPHGTLANDSFGSDPGLLSSAFPEQLFRGRFAKRALRRTPLT